MAQQRVVTVGNAIPLKFWDILRILEIQRLTVKSTDDKLSQWARGMSHVIFFNFWYNSSVFGTNGSIYSTLDFARRLTTANTRTSQLPGTDITPEDIHRRAGPSATAELLDFCENLYLLNLKSSSTRKPN